jgi:hypothetical protein
MRLKLAIHALVRSLLAALVALSTLAVGTHAQELSDAQRQARYLRLTQVNPLYAMPAVNLTQMEQAVASLVASRTEILSVADQYGAAQRKRIAAALYPTAYLSEMIALEVQRRALAKGAGKEQLRAYQSQLLYTIDAYAAYISSLLDALKATADDVSYKGLEYHFGRSSFTHFIAGIEAYHADAVRARDQAQARWACLETDLAECERPVWSAVPNPKPLDYSTDIFERAPARITRAIRAQGQLGGKPVGPGWTMLNGSDCSAGDTPVPYLLWRFPTASGVAIFRPEVVSDVLVHDHQIDRNSNAYERILDSLGMQRFLFQPHTNLYACPDAAGDSARLRTMAYMFAVAKTFDWHPTGEVSPELEVALARAWDVSQRLRTAPVLTETAAQRLAHEVTAVLADFGREQMIGALGATRLRQLETIALAYRLRTPYFAQDIMNLVYGNTAIGDYVPHAPWGFLEELLFTRNGPELLLGGTNPSIVRANEPQIEHFRDGTSPRLRSYVHDLSNAFDENEMIEILLSGLAAEYRLAQFLKRPNLFGK